MNGLIRKLVLGSGIVFIGRIFNAVCQYLLILLLGRFLGPAGTGLYFLGLGVMRFVNTGTMIGLNESLIKFIPDYLTKKEFQKVYSIIKFALSSTFLFSLSIAIVIYSSSHLISVYIFNDGDLSPVIKIFSICLPLFTSLQILISSIRSFRNMVSLSIVESMILPGCVTFLTFLSLLLKKCVETAVVAYFASIVISIVSGFFLLKRELPEKNNEQNSTICKGAIIRYSLPLMGSGIIGFLLMWMDTFMLGILKNTQSVGIYSGAARIALFSSIVLFSVNAIFAPTISKLYSEGDIEGLGAAYKATVRLIIYSSLPLYVIIFVFSKNIMGLYGTEFIQGHIALLILCAGQVVNISVGSAGYILSMTGRPLIELCNNLVIILMNFFLNLYLIPLIGMTGAALATGISVSMVNIMRVIENYLFLQIHPFSLKLIYPFSAHNIK